MEKSNYNGYKIDNNGRISIDSSKLIECIEFINSEKISKIDISNLFTIEHLDFLKDCPSILDVYLGKSAVVDFSGLRLLPNLKRLGITEDFNKRQCIYVEGLNDLEYLGITDDFKVLGIGKCTSLRELYFWKYKPKNKNLEEICNLDNLDVLRITQGNLTDLKGISNLRLRKLELYYLKNLTNIEEIKGLSNTLLELRFKNCPKIEEYEILGNLKRLDWLEISKCADIPNLRFVSQMKALKKMSFVDTNIVDGDLSPCIGLKYVGFNDKKHYSNKFQELNANFE